MSKQTDPPAPAWLSKKNYTKFRDYKLKDWSRQLMRIHLRSVELDLALHTNRSSLMTRGARFHASIMHAPYPTVILLKERPIPYSVFKEQLPALLVRLEAPDGVILQEVTDAIRRYREIQKGDASKPATYIPKSRFDPRIFSSWQIRRIIPLADLMIWRGKLSPAARRKYSDRLLGEWIGLNDKKSLDRSKRTLKKALASLDLIAAQLPHEPGAVTVLP